MSGLREEFSEDGGVPGGGPVVLQFGVLSEPGGDRGDVPGLAPTSVVILEEL
jgi:hypothetical protein